MATASVIAGQCTMIPLLTAFHPEEDSNWVKIEREVNTGTVAHPQYECRKTKVPKFNKPDVELLCHNIREFFDIADGIFALTQGATRFEYY